MIILGIETSCDETSVAIIEGKDDQVKIKSNIIASSLPLHAKTGGIIPEVAARAQLKFILPVLTEALEKAFGISTKEININLPLIDAIAVTYGPGLIGPLLIGVETARTLSFVWRKPIIPVNHMMGHIYANFVGKCCSRSEIPLMREQAENVEAAAKSRLCGSKWQISNIPAFPLIALVVSGGHTDLIYMKQHGNYEVLGGTRDDAAGEAFDKIGRLLGLTYPAGPLIEQKAKLGNKNRFNFPRPLMDPRTLDFSFSGLKTAVLREVKNLKTLDVQTINDIAAGTQAAIVSVLVKKTLRAVIERDVRSIILSGGVAANELLRDSFQLEIEKRKIGAKLYYPPKKLCTDNAAMIAAAGYFNYSTVDWKEITADPELYYE